ncbi:MAG TPA: HAMP domain-containing sensor histidine kinase [Allocoleopsis sp.]
MSVYLYQIALSCVPKPQILAINTITVNALLSALFDVFNEEKIKCNIIIKLPPGELWRKDLTPYQKVFSPEIIDLSNNLDQEYFYREYFILFLSNQICGLILVNRHQVKYNFEKKPILPTIFSFEKQTVATILLSIETVLSGLNMPSYQLINKWNKEILKRFKVADPLILNKLLNKQIQRLQKMRKYETNERILNAKIRMLERQNQTLIKEIDFKSELIKNTAQELRIPLTNMKTALGLLESTNLKMAQRQKYLHLLNNQCDRQTSLINGIVELMKLDEDLEKNKLHPVNLADIVPGVVSTYQSLAQEKEIMIGYTIPENLPLVNCLENWVKQIVINLLSNGIKFTPVGGRVLVKGKLQGEYILLEFQDTGIGIVSQELPKIFDRFYHGKPGIGEEVPGCGLGLTIVQQILIRCGGTISVNSKVGSGSIFKVLLPIYKG